MNEEILDVVDENDSVIGQKPRTIIHSQGLKHREVHVWFFNDQGQILFQKRSKNAETAAGLLDASVGGHVDLGQTYAQSAVKEVKEETGLDIKESDLFFLATIYAEYLDPNGLINNAFKGTFAYRFNSSLDELIPEQGTADGFEWVKIEDLFDMLSGEQKNLFTSNVSNKEYIEKIFGHIQTLINER